MGITVSLYASSHPNIRSQVQGLLWEEFKDDFQTHGGYPAFRKALDSFGQWREHQKVLFVATDTSYERVIGTASIEYAHDSLLTPCIANIYVHPSFRKQGHGKRLVQFCEKYIKKKGLSAAYLWCKPHLQSFYERLGYKPIGLPKSMQTNDDSIFLGKSF